MTPLVSIVLPTRNGAGTLPSLLDGLSRQRGEFECEIIAIDSGSTDGTVELLRQRADRLVTIAPDSFDHGMTRNLGIENSRGSLIVLLVQDAMPASETWLAELIAPFIDENVAGTFARQVPRPEASAITRHYHHGWVAASETPRDLAIDAAEFSHLHPMERYLRCTFDNVCSCIRRSVWQRHRFRPTSIAEDLEWAREVLLAGHRLVYAPKAVVMHSHDRPARYELVRTYVLHRRLYELFQLRTIPSLPALARAIATSCAVHLRCGGGISRALTLALAWPLGQYFGGLSAARGWKPIRSRMV
jgi:rhamnosyltransferase